MNQDPHIAAAVMFGRGKFQPGVLIDPKPEYKFDPNNIAKLEAFRNAVWYGFELYLSYVWLTAVVGLQWRKSTTSHHNTLEFSKR